jgi:integrase
VAARREYGTGSVYQRSSDGRWIGSVEAGWNPDGSRRRVTVSAKTEAEAKRRLRDKRNAIERDGLTDANPRVTVKQWADEWLTMRADNVRPATYTSDRSGARWIVRTIGRRKLADLTPADVRAVDRALVKDGKAASSPRTHAVLRMMLKAAVAEGHQIPQRVLTVKAPPAPPSDRDALTVDQAIRVLDIASTLDDGSRWVAALLQGMRQGECLGLTWQAVDLEAKAIDVSWQLQPLPYVDRAQKALGFRVPRSYECRRLVGAWHLVRPKTQRGRRVIPIVPWMETALTGWRDVAPQSPHDLVWPRLDGRPASDRDDTEEWHALQCAAGVGHPAGRWFHLHEARNTTATLLLEAGIDPEVIKAILGHSSIVTSRSYMTVHDAMIRDAMQKVAERLQLT